MAEIHGTCDERFDGVRDVLAASIDRGTDVGASVAVTVDGEFVVDIWGGALDVEGQEPWERDTITNVWSISKTMTSLCALILADAGELDTDAPVSRYWPEFAAGGKADRVLVRHVLGHTAGLSGWSEPLTVDDLYDWEKVTSLLAAQEPWWEPGTASGYHAVTQGFLIGEVARRITGQTIGEFFRDNVAKPLGADFHIGLDPAEFARVANVIPPAPLDEAIIAGASEMAVRTLGNPLLDGSESWTPAWRRAEIPAANGHGNARSVAAVQAVLANGGQVGGVRLLSAAGCERVLEEQAYGTDLVLGSPVRFGLGFGLSSAEMPISATGRACYWGGWGGSVVLVDMDAHMSFAYVMNRMEQGIVGDDRGLGLGLAVYLALNG